VGTADGDHHRIDAGKLAEHARRRGADAEKWTDRRFRRSTYSHDGVELDSAERAGEQDRDECRGTGRVLLLHSYVACSRGCPVR